LGLSFGLGVALGVIPGTGALIAAVCAALFRLNLPLMVSGAFLTNPLTAPFVYLGSFFLGQWLLGSRLPNAALPRLALGTLTGNLILAVGLGGLGYLVVLGLATSIRAHRSPRR
jgi:uncharacterized protein (DUF2062 family)